MLGCDKCAFYTCLRCIICKVHCNGKSVVQPEGLPKPEAQFSSDNASHNLEEMDIDGDHDIVIEEEYYDEPIDDDFDEDDEMN